MGMDVESWLKEGIVDTVICHAGCRRVRERHLRIAGSRRRGRGAQLCGCWRGWNRQTSPELASARRSGRSSFKCLCRRGRRRAFFHTYYPMPKRYPYDDAGDRKRLRYMGHPDLLGNLDKTYRLGIPVQRQFGSCLRAGGTTASRIDARPSGTGMHSGE